MAKCIKTLLIKTKFKLRKTKIEKARLYEKYP